MNLRLLLVACVISLGSTLVVPAQDESQPAKKPPNTAPLDEETEESLRTLDEMLLQLPTVDDLLNGKVFDWVVFRTPQKPVVKAGQVVVELGPPRVLVVEPLATRPNFLELLDAKYQETLKVPPPRDPAALAEFRDKQKRLQQLAVIPFGETEVGEYGLERKLVDRILYFEDLYLLRAQRELDARQVTPANELLWRLERRHPRWPGASEVLQRLLLVDAELRREAGRPIEALALIEEHLDRDAASAAGIEELAKVCDALMQHAVAVDDPRQVRHYLRRLESRAPTHATVKRWQADRETAAQNFVALARSAGTEGRTRSATLFVEQAARIWPIANGLREAHREVLERHPILAWGHVVLPAAESQVYPFPTPSQELAHTLAHLPWMEPVEFTPAPVRFSSRVFEAWEPEDLARSLRLRVRKRLAGWEAQSLPRAARLADQLRQATRRGSPTYDEQLGALVEHIHLDDEGDLVLQFRSAPQRIEALLWRISQTAELALPRFQPNVTASIPPLARTPVTTWSRVRPLPNGGRTNRIVDVDLYDFPNWESTLQALLRGDITGVSHVPLQDVARLREDGRFFVLKHQRPAVHLVQLNPERELLRLPEFRRALQASIPRKMLLQEHVLAEAELGLARLSATPVARYSTASNRLLAPPEHEPYLAATLALSAKKSHPEISRELLLACPPDELARTVCDSLVAAWVSAGIPVRRMTARDSASDWDLCYRTIRMTDPLVEYWPLVIGESTPRIEPTARFPHALRQRLFDLERASDWPAAVKLLHRAQADVLAEAWWLPLWEVDEFWIGRKSLAELPKSLRHPFDGIERWVLQSNIITETP